MATNNLIHIEVAYAASPKEQKLIALDVPSGTTLAEAIKLSQICELYPEIDLTQQAVGVHGEKRDLHDVLQNEDRVEIYRPLIIDPKEARRIRAKKKQDD